MAARIKKGDLVKVVTGDDKGKTGKVLQVLPDSGRALVEGLNFAKKHMRKTQDNPKGGVLEKEVSIHMSNLKKAE
ncbi:MAG: 50S ribosomal protein L24 [Kiritimatiellales bacterium]